MEAEKLEISYIPLSQAVLWDRNPKRHDIDAIITSIVKHGFKDPPKFEPELNGGRGGFAVGNGRTIALQMMEKRGDKPPRGIIKGDDGGWVIPVLFGVDARSQSAAESYGIDHNNLTLLGGDFGVTDTLSMWDDGIACILSDLMAVDELPVSVVDEDIAAILATLNAELPEEKPPLTDQGAQIDRAEELQKVWKVETGQVWKCGEHRIMCGDSTNSDDVERLLNGKEAAITITDPPYNVGINYGSGTMDNRSKIEYIAWSSKWLKHATHKKIFTVGIKRLTWWDEIAGEPQWIIAWIKRNGQGNTSLGGTNKWDAILLYNCPKDGGIDIIECNNDYSENIKASGGHPTAKPIELFINLADRFTSIGDIVYEPFCGTGTTIIACEQIGRIGYGMEIEPKYVAVCLQRFQDTLGIEPVLL